MAPLTPTGRARGAGTGALLVLVSVAVLAAGFFVNLWGVADPVWFETHQRDSEALVVARIVLSEQSGLLSRAGLTGIGVSSRLGPTDRTQHTQSREQVELQYDTFLNGGTFEGYLPYLSQPGAQGLALGVLDRVLPLSPAARLQSFRLLTALLTALALSAVVTWFRREYGRGVALSVLVTTAASPWLTVFGRNLYWQTWAYYVPMLAVAWALGRREGTPAARDRSLAAATFGAVLLKGLFSGFEYATTSLVMAAVPLVWAAVRHGWEPRRLVRSLVTFGTAATLAVLSTLVVLVAQISAVQGGVAAGLSHIRYSFAKRTDGRGFVIPEASRPIFDVPVSRVIGTYLDGSFLDLGTPAPVARRLLPGQRLVITYGAVVVVSLAAAGSLALLARRARRLEPGPDGTTHGRRLLSLAAATAFSLAAPLSWFVVFRAHSVVHVHMNFVVWQMPFTLFGFAACAAALGEAARTSGSWRRAKGRAGGRLSAAEGPSSLGGERPPPRTP